MHNITNTTLDDKFFREAEKLINTPVKQSIFFRLYYTASTVTYSMQELEGDYITITPEQFAIGDKNIFIKDGEIHKKNLISIGKLVPSTNGVSTNDTDITLIDNNSTTQWETKTYETD